MKTDATADGLDVPQDATDARADVPFDIDYSNFCIITDRCDNDAGRCRPEYVLAAFTSARYSICFDALNHAGYRPVWVDGFDVGDDTYINAIFQPANGISWRAFDDYDGVWLYNEFNMASSAGLNPVLFEMYRHGSELNWAGIETRRPATVSYAIEMNPLLAEHQGIYANYVDAGYRPVNLAPAEWNGHIWVSALYSNQNTGEWTSSLGLTSADLDSQTMQLAARGQNLAYLNAYTDNGTIRYAAIWNSSSPVVTLAHDLTTEDFAMREAAAEAAGMHIRMITGVTRPLDATILLSAAWSGP